MSILRPSSSQMTRRLIVLATVVFAIAISQVQMFMGWGQTAPEFSADSDTTLKVAGYAFAIWGVIYAGLLVYAIRQALPQTGESEMINRFGWPSILALSGHRLVDRGGGLRLGAGDHRADLRLSDRAADPDADRCPCHPRPVARRPRPLDDRLAAQPAGGLADRGSPRRI